jgi:hypothetical protein
VPKLNFGALCDAEKVFKRIELTISCQAGEARNIMIYIGNMLPGEGLPGLFEVIFNAVLITYRSI